ncbi:MAG: chemotaxis protein CheW [Pseudomonadota bacterium]
MTADVHVTPDDTPGHAETHQFLRFALGPETYAVRIDAVREILEVVHMTPLPLMPDFVRGVMNLRGAVVPVIDLGARLGLSTTVIGRRSCVVMVDIPAPEEGTQTLGVLVDSVYEVFDATYSDQENVPRLGTRISADFIRSMLRVRGQTTAEIDLASVLEQTALADLIAQHRPPGALQTSTNHHAVNASV